MGEGGGSSGHPWRCMHVQVCIYFVQVPDFRYTLTLTLTLTHNMNISSFFALPGCVTLSTWACGTTSSSPFAQDYAAYAGYKPREEKQEPVHQWFLTGRCGEQSSNIDASLADDTPGAMQDPLPLPLPSSPAPQAPKLPELSSSSVYDPGRSSCPPTPLSLSRLGIQVRFCWQVSRCAIPRGAVASHICLCASAPLPAEVPEFRGPKGHMPRVAQGSSGGGGATEQLHGAGGWMWLPASGFETAADAAWPGTLFAVFWPRLRVAGVN
jgi:hypothetical protein